MFQHKIEVSVPALKHISLVELITQDKTGPLWNKATKDQSRSLGMYPPTRPSETSLLAGYSETTPRKYAFDVTSVGQRSSPWTWNSVKVEIKFHLECKLHFPKCI